MPTKSLVWSVQYLSSSDNNIIIIHYDKKSDIETVSFLKKENVFFIENRIDIAWGGVSQINATLLLLKYSLKFDYDYCFFISGDDVPVMSNDRIDAFLLSNDNAEFIHYQDERNKYIDPYERCIYKYPSFFFSRKNDIFTKLLKKAHKITKPILFKNSFFIKEMKAGSIPKLYKGTNWFAFTYKTCEWIVNEVDSKPNYLKSFEYSLCADEVFFHSLLKTKPDVVFYHDTTKINDALRYIDWKSGPQYPKFLDSNDIDLIINSGCFFCRKVDDRMSDFDFTKFKRLVTE